MKITKLPIEDALLIEPDIHRDDRGSFLETYSKRTLGVALDVTFVQDNESYNKAKGTIRGLHIQLKPHTQSKLIRVARGTIKDVVVDIRKDSSTYLKTCSVILSADNGHQLFVPKGCLHGFVTLTDDALVEYKVDDFFAPECDRSVNYADKTFAVDWGVEKPVLSKKDAAAPMYRPEDFDF